MSPQIIGGILFLIAAYFYYRTYRVMMNIKQHNIEAESGAADDYDSATKKRRKLRKGFYVNAVVGFLLVFVAMRMFNAPTIEAFWQGW